MIASSDDLGHQLLGPRRHQDQLGVVARLRRRDIELVHQLSSLVQRSLQGRDVGPQRAGDGGQLQQLFEDAELIPGVFGRGHGATAAEPWGWGVSAAATSTAWDQASSNVPSSFETSSAGSGFMVALASASRSWM